MAKQKTLDQFNKSVGSPITIKGLSVASKIKYHRLRAIFMGQPADVMERKGIRDGMKKIYDEFVKRSLDL